MSTFNRTSHSREEDAGKEFPLRFSCSIFLGGVSLLLGFIPWLALTIPTAPRTDLPWFHNPMIYQYNGQNASVIRDDLDRIKDLGFSAILVGPIFVPEADDLEWSPKTLTTEGTSIGSTTDVKQLLEQAHQKGVKVIFEFEPNHTFLDHLWFKKSSSGIKPYHGFYVWQNPGKKTHDETPPNTWQNVAGKAAWTFSKPRGQYYYHQYEDDKPDLNLRDSQVRTLIEKFMIFWTNAGVDGFYIRSVPRLYENEELTASDYICNCDKNKRGPDGSQLTSHQRETLTLLSSWRTLFKENKDSHIFLAAEVCDCDGTLYKEYYSHGVDMVVHPTLWQGGGQGDPRCLFEKMNTWYSSLPARKWPGWMEIPVTSECSQSVMSLYFMSLPGARIVKHGDNTIPKYQLGTNTTVSDLRRHLAFLVGDTILLLQNQHTLVFMRVAEAKMFSKYIIAINFNDQSHVNINLTDPKTTQPGVRVPKTAQVVVSSGLCGKSQKNLNDKLNIGTVIKLKEESFVLAPNQGVILQTM